MLALHPKKLANVLAVVHSYWCSGRSYAHCKSIAASCSCATIAGSWTCLACRAAMQQSTHNTGSACKGKLPPAAATAAITPKSNTLTDYGAKLHAILKWSKNPNT